MAGGLGSSPPGVHREPFTEDTWVLGGPKTSPQILAPSWILYPGSHPPTAGKTPSGRACTEEASDTNRPGRPRGRQRMPDAPTGGLRVIRSSPLPPSRAVFPQAI